MDRRNSLRLLSITSLGLTVPGCVMSSARTASAAPGMPVPVMVSTNGIRMGVYTRGTGIPVIFCHGFPELAFSWRHQFHAVAEAGYQAIAPDLRGFGLTDRPEAVAAYTTATICDDLVGMMDAMGIEKAIFCGHDWGGFVVDTMPVLYPERCLGVVGIGAHNNQRPPYMSYPRFDTPQLVDKPGYNIFIQQPATEAFLDAHVRELYSVLFRQDYFVADVLATLPEDSPERRIDLVSLIRMVAPDAPLFVDQAALDFYVATFEATGFGGGINWYRAIDATIEEFDTRELHWGVEVPYLYIWPEQDPITQEGLEVHMEDYMTDLEKVALIGSGHFAQEHKPAALSAYLLEWLQRKFPVNARNSPESTGTSWRLQRS